MEFLYETIAAVTWQQVIMWCLGALLIFLAIKKDMEPALLLPMGFGAILINIPFSGAEGVMSSLFAIGIEMNEIMPLVLFIGIGAMIDFGPLLSNPKLFLFGGAAQFGIFLTILLAAACGFSIEDAASIGIIGAADGPTSIVVAQTLKSNYVGPIMVVAYSYMALVPIIQPAVIKLTTTKKRASDPYGIQARFGFETHENSVPHSRNDRVGAYRARVVVACRHAYVRQPHKRVRRAELPYRHRKRRADKPCYAVFGHHHRVYDESRKLHNRPDSYDYGAGALCIHFRHVLGRDACKSHELVPQRKNQSHDRCGWYFRIPHERAIVQKMGIKEDPTNHLLMHAVGANVSGQIASAIVGGLIIGLVL